MAQAPRRETGSAARGIASTRAMRRPRSAMGRRRHMLQGPWPAREGRLRRGPKARTPREIGALHAGLPGIATAPRLGREPPARCLERPVLGPGRPASGRGTGGACARPAPRTEQAGVEGGEHRVQRVLARHAVSVGQEAAQEGDVLPAPEFGLDQIVDPGQGGAERERQDLRGGWGTLACCRGSSRAARWSNSKVAAGRAGGVSFAQSAQQPQTRPRPKLTDRSPDRPVAATTPP